MAYDTLLAERIRQYLIPFSELKVEEKTMFRGLTFMVNGKMCISVSNDKLMCRFNPALQPEVDGKNGFRPMIMKGKELNGYCYVTPEGWESEKDFAYWMNLCLDYNEAARSSKKRK